MVERRDDLDLVYECPAGKYVYPTNLVTTGQVKRLAAISPHAEKKKKLEKSSQTQLPSTCMCGGESQGRDLSRFFFLFSLSLQIMYPRHTLPYLTLPYLTDATYRSKKQETSPKNRYTQTATRRGRRGRGRWGGEPKNRVLKVMWFLPSTWVRFSKKNTMHDSTYLPTCTCRYGTFYQVKLYLLSPPISFSRSMQRSRFKPFFLWALGRYLLPTNPTSDSVRRYM